MSVPLRVCDDPGEDTYQVTVATMSPVPELCGRVVAYLAHAGSGVRHEHQARLADVLVAMTPTVTDEFVADLEAEWNAAENPNQVVVLATGSVRESQLSAVFRAGVAAIVHLRDLNTRTIENVVLAVADGQAVVSGQISRWLIDEQRIQRRKMIACAELEPDGLTRREIDVLRLVADGMETSQIAARMNYSERTIKKVLADLMRRRGLRNRAHAVSYALQHGVL